MRDLLLSDPTLLRQQHLIDGRWADADGGATLAVHNPATGALLARVPDAGAAETERAIAAAAAAFEPWRNRTAEDRGRILRRWFDLMLQHQDDLALLMTSEQGKPLAEARGEIAYAASYIEWFAEEARRVYGEVIPSPWPDKRIVVTREPVGVCAAITPWNFPAAMITRKVAPALAAGCSIIVKPAAQTPLSALAMADLAQRAGVPAGVFNLVNGDGEGVGAPLSWDNVPVHSPSLGYVHATHGEDRSVRSPGAVITYYEPLPGDDAAALSAQRTRLLTTSLESWADHVRAALVAMHPELAREIAQIHVTRWGHAMIRPVPGLLFGAALTTAGAAIGRVRPCAADTTGLPLFEEAFYAGLRAAEAALTPLLGRELASLIEP